MEWTRSQLDEALAKLSASVPQMVSDHPDAAGFAREFQRASAAIEARAGRNADYVSRRIDALLASLVKVASPRHPVSPQHGLCNR